MKPSSSIKSAVKRSGQQIDPSAIEAVIVKRQRKVNTPHHMCEIVDNPQLNEYFLLTVREEKEKLLLFAINLPLQDYKSLISYLDGLVSSHEKLIIILNKEGDYRYFDTFNIELELGDLNEFLVYKEKAALEQRIELTSNKALTLNLPIKI